jgi:glycosyltransferase involved in cell wall biosynthesis
MTCSSPLTPPPPFHLGGGVSWIGSVGAKRDREKVLHLALGHLMLNPGMVGLGILDSFAMGLPMVTTDCKIHSPEIAYLNPARNGIITENSLGAFTEQVQKLLVNPGLRQKIAEEGMKDSSQYLLQNMVQKFSEGITDALNAPCF